MELIHKKLQDLVSKISSSTLENEASFESSKVVLQALFATRKAFELPAPRVPPPKPLAVASGGVVPAFSVPISKWGTLHYCTELGDRAPGAQEKGKAADRVDRMASPLSGPDGTQLSVASKRALSICLIGVGGRFGVPLPFPHAPLFLEEEEHLQVWKSVLDSSWVSEWNPPLAITSSPTPPKGPKDRRVLTGPTK